MTTPAATSAACARFWPPRGVAGWLALAASPTFAFMAWIAASAPPTALCSDATRLLPIDGMAAMYLLMSLFHLAPWLTLAQRRHRAFA